METGLLKMQKHFSLVQLSKEQLMQINSNAAIMVRDTVPDGLPEHRDLDCLCHLTVKTLSTSLHHCAFIVFRDTGRDPEKQILQQVPIY